VFRVVAVASSFASPSFAAQRRSDALGLNALSASAGRAHSASFPFASPSFALPVPLGLSYATLTDPEARFFEDMMVTDAPTLSDIEDPRADEWDVVSKSQHLLLQKRGELCAVNKRMDAMIQASVTEERALGVKLDAQKGVRQDLFDQHLQIQQEFDDKDGSIRVLTATKGMHLKQIDECRASIEDLISELKDDQKPFGGKVDILEVRRSMRLTTRKQSLICREAKLNVALGSCLTLDISRVDIFGVSGLSHRNKTLHFGITFMGRSRFFAPGKAARHPMACAGDWQTILV